MEYSAKLVAVTKPLDGSSSEDLIVYCARVSNPANQSNYSTSLGLLRYLMREKHWSPFEMAHAVVEVECPRDIARQILRHRSFSFQEFSQRYAAILGLISREFRRQDYKNRQNSINDLPRWKRLLLSALTWLLIRYVSFVYALALRLDIAKETARVILPEGLTISRLYMAGTVRSFLHYCEVREGNGTQYEHILVAKEIRKALSAEFPNIFGDGNDQNA
jgi:thymidylate synthase (FAD)